jgi:hypothetical protein
MANNDPRNKTWLVFWLAVDKIFGRPTDRVDANSPFFAKKMADDDDVEEFEVNLGESWSGASSASLSTLRYERRFQVSGKRNDSSLKIAGNIELNRSNNEVQVNWHAVEVFVIPLMFLRFYSFTCFNCSFFQNI